MIVVNRGKAEDTTRERLRAERNAALEALDVKFMRALEQSQDTTAIAAEKQVLRDVTTKDMSALSLEQLAALTLEEALTL